MLTSLFQLQGFRYVDLESGPTKHGPFSSRRPIKELAPGPPFNQIARGAFSGAFRASKNQKNLHWLSKHSLFYFLATISRRGLRVDRVVLSFLVQEAWRKVNVARIGLDPRRGLTYTRLCRVSVLAGRYWKNCAGCRPPHLFE